MQYVKNNALVWHVDVKFGWRNHILPRALSDNNASLFAEHWSYLGWLRHRGLVGIFTVFMVNIVGDITILPQEREDF